MYAAKAANLKLAVFVASASTLVLASAIAVLAGPLVSAHLNEKLLSWVAGCGFIAIGLWTILRS